VIEDDGPTPFRLRSANGDAIEVGLDAVTVSEYRTRALRSDWLPALPRAAYLRRRSEWHWVEPTADGGAVHVGYNVTRGDIERFSSEVETLAAERHVRTVVVDLRLNSGGDNRTYRPLLDAVRRVSTDKPIAVLTSRVTFSAAMQFVVDLEQQTPAVFVGEPTGGSPNHYGDATVVHLPESRLNAHVATMAWMTAGDGDVRLTREPDIRVAQESSAFFANDDTNLRAALEAVSQGRHPA
jgi:C-terminal processing protease CtpA/Prc